VCNAAEKKWDTVIPADLKRLFVSGTHVPLVTKGLKGAYKNVTWFLKDGSILLKQGFVEIYSYVK
jgi:hypothetical protein